MPTAPIIVSACPDRRRGQPRTHVGGTTGFVGDWWRTEITTDDDESSSIRLNQRREAIKPKVRGPLRYEILDY